MWLYYNICLQIMLDIKQHLVNLKKDGIVKRIGSTKSGYWEVVNKDV